MHKTCFIVGWVFKEPLHLNGIVELKYFFLKIMSVDANTKDKKILQNILLETLSV